MTEATWLEVSLTVDGEMAEAVSEVLARFAPDGVAIESTAVIANLDDSEGHAVGPLRVCAYLPMDGGLEETRSRLEEALWYLGRIRPLPEAQYRQVQQADWSEAWKEHYRPILIGKRLVVVPAWLESPDPRRIAMRMDPGMAFGTGTHPTTQLCLEWIEEFYSSPAQPAADGQPRTAGQTDDIIDIGCGSGILAVAALKLGARHALGVDVDPEAVSATLENAALNAVGDGLEVGLGSVRGILAGDFSIRQAPLVVANILAPVIVRLLDEGMGKLVFPGGRLVLSGILAEQSAEVEAALTKVGFRRVEKRQQGDWVALSAWRWQRSEIESIQDGFYRVKG
jgi:ribosomal protein L11 methyltransferase